MDELVKQWVRQNKNKVNKASDGMVGKAWNGARQGAYNGAKAVQRTVNEASKTVQKGLDMITGGKK